MHLCKSNTKAKRNYVSFSFCCFRKTVFFLVLILAIMQIGA